MRKRLLALLIALSPLPAAAACPDVPAVARLAQAMLDRSPPPAPFTGLTMADGICARERLASVLAQPWGDRMGWKVGLTNPAAQARFGVPHPVAGALFHGTLRARSGAEFPAGFGLNGAVESDLLVRIRDAGINQAGHDPVALLHHIEAVIPFIELPDLVWRGEVPWSGPLLLAINVGARFGVLGEEIPAEATSAFAARLASMRVTLSDEGGVLAEAPGSALMGHPLAALAWLIQALRAEGRGLQAGDHVSLGGFSPALPVVAGRTYSATYTGLASAPVQVTVRIR